MHTQHNTWPDAAILSYLMLLNQTQHGSFVARHALSIQARRSACTTQDAEAHERKLAARRQRREQHRAKQQRHSAAAPQPAPAGTLCKADSVQQGVKSDGVEGNEQKKRSAQAAPAEGDIA